MYLCILQRCTYVDRPLNMRGCICHLSDTPFHIQGGGGEGGDMFSGFLILVFYSIVMTTRMSNPVSGGGGGKGWGHAISSSSGGLQVQFSQLVQKGGRKHHSLNFIFKFQLWELLQM